jgi:RNAse (barnase) inhibitor barstar
MSALSNLPAQAVLPLGAYRLPDLERQAAAADQRWLHADCGKATDKAGVMSALAGGFSLPAYFGANLDALYDCLTDLEPLPDARQPGMVLVLEGLPDGPGFDAAQRDALLDVFRDAADDFFERQIAFRVFYSVRDAGSPPRPSRRR